MVVLLFVLMFVLVGDSPPTAAVAVAAVACCSDTTDYSTIYNWLADRFEESEPTGAETTSLAPKGELSEKALQHTMYCRPIVNVYVLSCESTLIGVVRTCTYVTVYVRRVAQFLACTYNAELAVVHNILAVRVSHCGYNLHSARK